MLVGSGSFIGEEVINKEPYYYSTRAKSQVNKLLSITSGDVIQNFPVSMQLDINQ